MKDKDVQQCQYGRFEHGPDIPTDYKFKRCILPEGHECLHQDDVGHTWPTIIAYQPTEKKAMSAKVELYYEDGRASREVMLDLPGVQQGSMEPLMAAVEDAVKREDKDCLRWGITAIYYQ